MRKADSAACATPMQEAEALIAAREEQIFALKMASRQRQPDCSYECPPN